MRLTAAVAIISLLPLSAAMADVYRSVDAQGHVLYSDTPTPGAELVRKGAARYVSQTSSLTATPKPASAQQKPAAQAADDPLAQASATRSVQNDVAQNRAEQCKQAKDVYEKSVVARRIYNVAPDGTRTYMSDEDAQKNRVNNKLQMDEVCGDASSSQ